MTPPQMQRSGTVVDARMSLAMWLRAGRSQRNMSLEDVARVTKIQVRILEKLEAGTIKTGDGMPAEVFVRGFVRSIAKCLGLDESEALRRYTEAATQAALDLSPTTATASARAFVESMSELAPQVARTTSPRMLATAPTPTLAAGSLVTSVQQIVEAARIEAEVVETQVVEAPGAAIAPVEVAAPVVETAAVVEPTPVVEPVVEAAPSASGSIEVVDAVEASDGKKKKAKKGTGKGRKRKAIATGTPFEAMPVVAQTADTLAMSATEIAPTEIASTESASTESASTETSSTATELATAPATAPSTARARRVSGIVNTSEALAFASFVATNGSTSTAVDPSDAVATSVTETFVSAPVSDASSAVDSAPVTDAAAAIAAIVAQVDSTETVAPGETWAPRMPVVVAPTVPWRIAASAQSLARSKSTSRIVPSIVIDDSAPDLAERELEDRAASRSPDLSAVRRSFLPPILMDREDRSARQGGLTLAVIILLIAATLTLSYLMRRPSSSGDGVTQTDLVESVDQLA